MNIKHFIISVFVIAISFFAIVGCDKIEPPFFKPVYTDRNVLAEFITDAETIDNNTYSDFVTLTANDIFIPVAVLSGNTQAEGNEDVSNNIVSDNNLNTSDSLVFFNRIVKSTKTNWESDLNTETEKKGEFSIDTDGQLDFATNTYTGNYTITSLNKLDAPIKLYVYLLEDSVNINNIIVSNVLREELSSINIATETQREEVFSGDFSFNLSTRNLVKLYAFNYKLLFVLEQKDTKEVLQANTLTIGLNFSKKQNILIEDFTGNQCVNCPSAHDELVSLMNTHGHQVIGMAIHYGFFAWPFGVFEDFQTEVGNTIGDAFVGSSAALPQGLINRKGEGNQRYFDPAAWDGEIGNLINNESIVGISFSTEIKNQTIEADIYVKAFQTIDETLKIQALVTESGIISPQLDRRVNPQTIMDYEHNHVLRASMNGNWGDDLTTLPFAQDQIVNHKLSLPVNADWNSDHLSLIVIVYNDVTKEIIQVEEKHL